MNCLTDQICFLSSFQDTLTQATNLIDFFGSSIAGEDWKALTPVLQQKLDVLLEIAARIAPYGFGSCDTSVAAETVNA